MGCSGEQIAELISSLEQATLMSHQLGTAVDQDQLLQISSSLRLAHHRLSAFLSEKSVSSSSVEPMQLGEEEEAKGDSTVGMVEEKMRECFIRNKRPKRALSPSSALVETSANEIRNGLDFDPLASKLRAFDLIYQFHG